jgi:arsenite/tail-anchored protein-transporting ATPase
MRSQGQVRAHLRLSLIFINRQLRGDKAAVYHREVTRQMGKTNLHFTTPMMQLQDPKQTKILIVTLAEKTPVLEAANLQSDLRRAGIEPWAWVINNSVAATVTNSPLLHQRALNELVEINAVEQDYSKRYAVVAMLKDEPIGVARLLELAGSNN